MQSFGSKARPVHAGMEVQIGRRSPWEVRLWKLGRAFTKDERHNKITKNISGAISTIGTDWL